MSVINHVCQANRLSHASEGTWRGVIGSACAMSAGGSEAQLSPERITRARQANRPSRANADT